MRRALPQHLMGKQVFATAFAGRELSRMMTWGAGDDRRDGLRSGQPVRDVQCAAARARADPARRGARLRRRHPLRPRGRRHRPDGRPRRCARVRQRRTGEELEIRARYAVGCDGARSIVGETGGFEFEGEAGLGNAITVWIEADLTRYTKHRSGALFFVCGPGSEDVFSIWTCVEPWTEWSTIFARHGGAANDLSEETRPAPRARGDRRSGRRRPDQEDQRMAGQPRGRGATTATGACSSPATPPTATRRPTASAATPRSRTPTTWPGSWRW